MHVLNVQPGDLVLEIGCGSGVLAEQIASKLTSGSITAVDQSAPMIEKAIKKNRHFVESQKASFILGSFASQLPQKGNFNKVVAFNVNVFWKNPERELELIRQSLTKGGAFYLFHQAPYDIDMEAAAPLVSIIKKNHFKVLDTLFKKLHPTSAICIIAQP